MINVAVVGAMGKMGKEVIKTVINDSKTRLIAAVDKFGVGQNVFENVAVEADIKKAFENNKPDVVVDFTQPSTIFENAKIYLEMKVKPVIGTTGLGDSEIEELKQLSQKSQTGCLIAPNFAIGAVLMMMFAKTASKYFNNAEIIELHHNQKKDAPSGTAIKTAKIMGEINPNFQTGNAPETELIKGARGAHCGSSLNVHSIRMPGFIASQEVIFGANGQILTIKHDTTNRECFMSGVLLAIKYIYENNKFVYGLENIL